MNKIFTGFMALVIAGLFTTPAFAVEHINDTPLSSVSPFEVLGMEFPDKNYSQWLDNTIAEVESLEDLAFIVKERFDAGYYSSIVRDDIKADRIAQANEAVRRIEPVVDLTSINSGSVTEQRLVVSLCTWDGFGVSDLLTVNSCKNIAQQESSRLYPYDETGLQDTYRHFVWSFLMTEDLSKTMARTAACDYEWARILLPYAASAYEDYIADGYSSSAAEGEAYTFAFIMRENIYAICESNQDFFNATFPADSVRDLWNNCYGRAYADEAAYTYDGAFNIANNAGELINSNNSVTEDHFWCVWAWDWYTA